MRVHNWKVSAVAQKATSLGFRVAFVRQAFGPRHAQNRVFVNRRRCQLMTGLRRIAAHNGDETVVDLWVPQSGWAEFVIYVPEFAENEQPFFVVPRSCLPQTPRCLVQQLSDYANSWHLLRGGEQRGIHSSAVPDIRLGNLMIEGMLIRDAERGREQYGE